MKWIATVIALSTTSIVVLFLTLMLDKHASPGKSCIETAVQMTVLKADGYEIPELVYADYERICRVDLRPEEEEEEEDVGGTWF